MLKCMYNIVAVIPNTRDQSFFPHHCLIVLPGWLLSATLSSNSVAKNSYFLLPWPFVCIIETVCFGFYSCFVFGRCRCSSCWKCCRYLQCLMWFTQQHYKCWCNTYSPLLAVILLCCDCCVADRNSSVRF